MQRWMTLVGVGTAIGISKRALSKWDTGQRRPTLERPLALSHAYRVCPDGLVAASGEGDPRRHVNPGRIKGRTVIQLTGQPDAAHVWKFVTPTSQATAERWTHHVHEWIYVLSRRMRFVLGDQDLVLAAGDVA